MSDMNIERRRLSQQMRQDLSELKFSAAMREAVLARVRAGEAAHPHELSGQSPLTRAAFGDEAQRHGGAQMRTGHRPDLRAVPAGTAASGARSGPSSRAGGERRERPMWQKVGVWLTGGTVAAAALVFGILLSGPAPGSGLPEQRLADAPGADSAEEFQLMSAAGALEADTSGDVAMIAMTESDPGSEANAVDGDGSDDPDAAVQMTAAVDGEDQDGAPDGDGDAPGEVPFGTIAAEPEDPRPGVGVAAQPPAGGRLPGTVPSGNLAGDPVGTTEPGTADAGGDGGLNNAERRESGNEVTAQSQKDQATSTTLKDLNKEAELVVLAQVKNVKGNELTLSPLHSLKGKLPKGDLTVTMPAGEKDLSKRALVIAFLRQAESAGNKHGGKQATRWRLVGGMAGIFRLDGDNAAGDGLLDLDSLKWR